MSIFSNVFTKRPRRNKFDMTHERKMAVPFGGLVPCFLSEVVPGDKFRVSSELFVRLAPLLAPLMHRIDVYVHYFFVPNRLVWNEWEDFITGGPDGTAAPVHPYVTIDDDVVNNQYMASGTLADYLGLPTFKPEVFGGEFTVSALPFRAYQMVYNEYFRDQNLSNPVEFGLGSGEVSTFAEVERLLQLRFRAWEKDYFTSCLPWTQRGPEATMPVTGNVNITYKNTSDIMTLGGADPAPGALEAGAAGDLGKIVDSDDEQLRIENIQSAQMLGSTATINDLRRSIRLQEWLEKNARGGARYIEQILSHFGVMSSDARLQRPEYLGGGRVPVSISEVVSTYQDPDGEGTPQGNMAGHGIAVGKSNQFKKFFEEHGFVIGMMSIRPRTAYQQGVSRTWRRFSKFDYYWPEFAHIGEQDVRLSELFVSPSNPNENFATIFGYQSRYAEYKYMPSTVHGSFRDSLAFWHMGRIWDSQAEPALNEEFVNMWYSFETWQRAFAAGEEAGEHAYVQCLNHVSALRPMPYFGTPNF